MHVYKLTDKRQLNDGTQTYMLHFCSREFLRDLRTKVSETFEGRIDQMVYKILGDPDYLDSRKKLFYQKTRNQDKITIPNRSPLKAIEMGLLTVEKKGKINAFSGRVLEIEGLEKLKVEQAFEVIPKIFERQKQLKALNKKNECVVIWPSVNPVNDLVYGYGAVKVFSRTPFINNNKWAIDMSTSLSDVVISKDVVSCETRFNTTPESAWIGAFRECAKLSSKIIPEQVDRETEHRLDVWCNVGADSLYGDWSILGAQAGKNFGRTYKEDNRRLMMINDMNVMRQLYDRYKV